MKKIIVLELGIIFILSMSIIFAASNRFLDVDSSHWAYESINTLSEYKILEGYPDGTYQPEKTVSRAEFSKILVTVLDLKTASAKDVSYNDVPKDHWAYRYIKVVSALLPANQSGDSSLFYPNEAIKREEVATALIKAVEWENKEYDKKSIEKFTDKDLISGDSFKYIAIASENELMNGNADGSFNPKGSLTRAEIAKLVYNIYLNFRHMHFEQFKEEMVEEPAIEIPKNVLDSTSSNYYDEVEFVRNGQTIIQRVGKVSGDTYHLEYVKSNSSSTNYYANSISLDVVSNNQLLQDGKTYTLYTGDKIYAFINNPSSTSNYIYYMFSYGNSIKTTKVQKIASKVAIISVPSEITTNNFRLSIWGTSMKNGRNYVTSTDIFSFNRTARPLETGNENLIWAQNDSNITITNNTVTVNKDLDFIVIFNGDTYKEGATLANAKVDQKIIVRGKPVNNMQSIKYRWDDGVVESIEGATGTITIPKTYTKDSTHQITIIVTGKDGTISAKKTYTVGISVAY